MKKIAVLAFLLSASAVASASPHALPFSYPYETLPDGKLEVEQYADMVPVRVARENPDGTLEGVYGVRSILQTELEYGLTDRIEVGWYFLFKQGASSGTPALRFSGVKQRARVRLAEAGEWPVDVGLYFEIAELNDEIEFEEKILLAKRFGRINVLANLWVEQEYYFQTGDTKYIYNPTLGASYEITPRFMVGMEYWARGRFDSDVDLADDDDTPTGTHHYVGPTFLFQKSSVFLSLGTYVRLDNIGNSMQTGDPFGKLWVRALIGVEL